MTDAAALTERYRESHKVQQAYAEVEERRHAQWLRYCDTTREPKLWAAWQAASAQLRDATKRTTMLRAELNKAQETAHA